MSTSSHPLDCRARASRSSPARARRGSAPARKTLNCRQPTSARPILVIWRSYEDRQMFDARCPGIGWPRRPALRELPSPRRRTCGPYQRDRSCGPLLVVRGLWVCVGDQGRPGPESHRCRMPTAKIRIHPAIRSPDRARYTTMMSRSVSMPRWPGRYDFSPVHHLCAPASGLNPRRLRPSVWVVRNPGVRMHPRRHIRSTTSVRTATDDGLRVPAS